MKPTKQLNELIRQLPLVLMIHLIVSTVTVVCGLVIPMTVLATVPITLMVGVWVGSIGFRIGNEVPTVHSVSSTTPLGHFAWKTILLGVAPFILAGIGILVLSRPAMPSEHNLATRFLVVAYAVPVIPLLLMTRSQAIRTKGGQNDD